MARNTPEGKVKKKVSALLRRHNVYYEMPVPSGFGKSGLDYHCCYNGKYFAIETKAPGKGLTARQLKTKYDIERAGGRVFVIVGWDIKGWTELEVYLSGTQNTMHEVSIPELAGRTTSIDIPKEEV